jgi:riboflavin kinase/FMN adenylyltransferase
LEQTKKVIALGFFDGVHLGHAALLRKVTETAVRLNAIPAAVTFDVHPENVIFGRGMPLLSSPNDRADLMRRLCGIHEVIIARFDRRMMQMPWQEFVTEFLMQENGAVHLVAGHDFHFGYKGEGNPDRLKALCAELGIGCDIVPKIEQDGITISSTYIRTLVAQGEMERASAFLGHPHTITETVVHGKRLGRTLGFPTVNLTLPDDVLIPALGVYVTRIYVDGKGYMAAANVGMRPTVDDSQTVNIEGFLLDFDGVLYGKTLRMEFYRYLRPEQKFPSLDALKEEIMRNVEQTRDYFQGHEQTD